MNQTPASSAAPGPPSPPDPPRSNRGVLVTAGVLLLVLAALLVGYRTEISRSWGLAGDQGRFVADACQRPLTTDGRGEVRNERVQCSGLLIPDGGGDPYPVDARFSASTDRDVRAGADGPRSDAYRADLWGRWAAVSLPLLPLAFLWLLPGSTWALRRPGALTPSQRTRYLLTTAVPATTLLLLGIAGFTISLLLT